ncbi:MAG: O-antigen ligase family protein [Planctomycetes bacterium]|nr:O-antigen ligase family protein [Planctomycetota bacterium]
MTLCVAPWFLGGVEPDVQVWLDAGIFFSLALWTVFTVFRCIAGHGTSQVLPTLLVPLCGALLLGAYQLLPSSIIAPKVVDAGSPTPVLTTLQGQPAGNTLFPAATRLEQARIGYALMACFLGATLFSTPRSQTWLWCSMALNGAALAFFGIVQQLSWNGKLYWTIPLLLGGQPFASFVNRNNAAGYLNICLACAAGWVLWAMTRRVADALLGSRPELDLIGRAASRYYWLNTFGGNTWTAVTATSMIIAGIICSLSRGGVLALLAASLAATLLMMRVWGKIATATFALGICVFVAGMIYWTGLETHVFSRWRGPHGDTVTQGAQTRLANWHDALTATKDFPVTGSGFGTYRYAYLPYESWPANVRFLNADNQFLEVLVEGGPVGLGLLLAGLGLSLLATLVLVYCRPNDPAGLVGVILLVSQPVSAALDFGPSLSSNMLAIAVLCGAITGRAADLTQTRDLSRFARYLALPQLRPAVMIVLISVSLLVHGGLGLCEVMAAADSRVARRALPRRLDDPKSLDEPALDQALSKLTMVVLRHPDDAEAHAALAHLWIYRYRLQAMRQLQQEQQSVRGDDWARTDLVSLYTGANAFAQNGQFKRLEDLRELPVIKTNLIPARRHLEAAQAACPLMPGLDVPRALLGFVADPSQTTGESALRRAILLTPSNPELLETCGQLARVAGKMNLARTCWRRCLVLDPTRFSRIAAQLPGPVTVSEQLAELVPDSPDVWVTIALAQLSGDSHRAERHRLAHKVKELATPANTPVASSDDLRHQARLYRLLDDSVAAEGLYRQAMSLEPMNVDLRMELLDALQQRGQWSSALQQAELCHSLDPGRSALVPLIQELRLKSLRSAKQ